MNLFENKDIHQTLKGRCRRKMIKYKVIWRYSKQEHAKTSIVTSDICVALINNPNINVVSIDEVEE